MRSKKTHKRKFQNKKIRKTKKNSNKYRANKTQKKGKSKTKMRGGMRTSVGRPKQKLCRSCSTTGLSAVHRSSQSMGLRKSNLLQRFNKGERVLFQIEPGQFISGLIIEVNDKNIEGQTIYIVKGDNGKYYQPVQDGRESFDKLIFSEPNPGDHKELGCMCPSEFPICGKAKGGYVGGWCMNNETEKQPTTDKSGCGGASGESCKYSRNNWIEEYIKKYNS